MAKIPFFGSSLLLCLAFFSALPSIPSAAAAASVVKDDAWVSPTSRVSCTMCASCDNPCHPLPPPGPTVWPPPPPSYAYNNPPPPSSSYIYGPPPPPSYPFPPSSVHYPGPPPPHRIMPYFPYYFYSPPPPSGTFSGGSCPRAAPFASTLQLSIFLLPFLLFF